MLSSVPNEVKNLAFLMNQRDEAAAALAKVNDRIAADAAAMNAKLEAANTIAAEAAETCKAHEAELRSTYGDEAVDAVLQVIDESRALQAQQDEKEKHLSGFFAPKPDSGNVAIAADSGSEALGATVVVEESN